MSYDNTTNGKLLPQVRVLYNKFRSWRLVGHEVAWEAADRGVIASTNGQADSYAALANALHRGAIDDSPKLREALGLPPKTVTVEPCPDCGEVHTADWCTRDGPPITRGRRQRERKRTRLAADVSEAQRAALKQHASDEGYSGWSAYCRALADRVMEADDG